MPANWDTVTIPQAGTDSDSFEVPRGVKVLQLFIPALEAATTIELQALTPKLQTNEADAWTLIRVFDLTDGTFTLLSAMTAGIITLPVSATGPGPLRCVASGAQTTAAREIRVAYGMDG